MATHIKAWIFINFLNYISSHQPTRVPTAIPTSLNNLFTFIFVEIYQDNFYKSWAICMQVYRRLVLQISTSMLTLSPKLSPLSLAHTHSHTHKHSLSLSLSLSLYYYSTYGLARKQRRLHKLIESPRLTYIAIIIMSRVRVHVSQQALHHVHALGCQGNHDLLGMHMRSNDVTMYAHVLLRPQRGACLQAILTLAQTCREDRVNLAHAHAVATRPSFSPPRLIFCAYRRAHVRNWEKEGLGMRLLLHKNRGFTISHSSYSEYRHQFQSRWGAACNNKESR